MNRKIPIGIAISIAAIACAVTFVITMTVSLNNYNGKIADVGTHDELMARCDIYRDVYLSQQKGVA